MPKKKKGNKSKDKDVFVGGAAGTGKPSRDDNADDADYDEDDDLESHLSLDDDLESVAGTDFAGDVSEDAETVLQDKIGEFLENTVHKTTSVRLAAFKGLELTLTRYFVPEILANWKMTIADSCEKSLKRGNCEEARIAVKLVALLALQLGVDASDVVCQLTNLIRPISIDPSLSQNFRAECATALSLCSYIAVDELEPLLQAIQCLHQSWTSVKFGNSGTESINLFCYALAGWSLLLTQVPPRRFEEVIGSGVPKLCSYFESNQVEIRIAAGETLALIYELGAQKLDPNFRPPNHQQTLETLEMLSTDSLKYRAKRDRRVQRCNFRQIYQAIKDKQPPFIPVKFSGETLEVDKWARKLVYDTCCQVLRGGMNNHLQKNTLLRDMFDLGPPGQGELERMTKNQKQTLYQTVDKARTQHRGKQRDKRTAAFNAE